MTGDGAVPTPRSARRRTTAAAWLGLLLCLGLLVWSGRQAFLDEVHRRFGPQLAASMSGEQIPDGPLSRRRDASAVWTGTEFVVWGGYASAGNFTYVNHADGAAYDPATKRWRTIAKAPISGREEHAAVWTGREMIIVGGTARTAKGMPTPVTGAAYDPATDRWRRIAPAPPARNTGSGRSQAVAWGRTIAVTMPRDDPAKPSAVLLYDVAGDSWSTLPAPGPAAALAVYRGWLAVAGTSSATGPWLTLFGPGRAGPFTLPLPEIPRGTSAFGLVATDRALTVLSTDGERTAIARWSGDPAVPFTGAEPRWQVREVPGGSVTLPVDLFSNFPGGSGALDDRRVVVWDSQDVSVLDLGTGAYRRVGEGANFCNVGAATAWTGSRLLAWGGNDCGPGAGRYAANHGHAYTVRPVRAT